MSMVMRSMRAPDWSVSSSVLMLYAPGLTRVMSLAPLPWKSERSPELMEENNCQG